MSQRSVTVVIPTRHRHAQLARCLETLVAQTYPGTSMSVCVVDDGGDCSAVVGQFASRLNVIRVPVEHGGPARARNAGASAARGDIVAFVDDDCAPRPDWLATLVAGVGDGGDVLAGGAMTNALAEDPFASAGQLLTDYLHDYHNGRDGAERPARFLTSSNMAVARVPFLAAGGFDTRFRVAAGEDRELCERWHSRGGVLRFVPAAVVEHAHALSFRGFVRQHFNYGRAAEVNRAARAASGSAEPPLQRSTFYLGMMRHALVHGGARGAVLVALSQAAYGAGWVREVARGTPEPSA